MSRVVYMDGKFLPEAKAKLSIYDLSVMQAAAAFEMTRSFNGVHFKLRQHAERLIESCRLLSIPFPLHGVMEVELIHLCHEVSRLNEHGPGEEHRLLIVVSPGCASIYKDLDGVIDHPFVYIADFPLRYTVQGFSTYFTEGVHCVTSTIQQVPDACVPSAAKHRSRLHFHLAQQQAPGGTWPILPGPDGNYTEAPGANLVCVAHGAIWTVESCALPGISMATVKDLMPASPIAADVRLQTLDELWLTGTPYFALPVVSLDGQPIGGGTIGPVYRAMMEKANALVGLNIAEQIIQWDQEADTRQGTDGRVHEAVSREKS